MRIQESSPRRYFVIYLFFSCQGKLLTIEQVLQQHKLAGIMLRKELKAQQRRERNREVQDARVAIHHEHDTDFPPCHTYGPCHGKSNVRKVQVKQAKMAKKVGKEKIGGKRRSSIADMERRNLWTRRHSSTVTVNEPPPPRRSFSERSKSLFDRSQVTGENENTKIADVERKRAQSWTQRHSLSGGGSAM